jgi:hypothetical protein
MEKTTCITISIQVDAVVRQPSRKGQGRVPSILALKLPEIDAFE